MMELMHSHSRDARLSIVIKHWCRNWRNKRLGQDFMSPNARSSGLIVKRWSYPMRCLPLIIGAVAALAASGASAQSINLTGTYRCIQNCRDGYLGAPAFVTQNGEHLNLVTETGDSYRAVPDWYAPASRIWIDARDEGAVYSPDGIRIQFDDGRVWQRDIGPAPPVVFRRSPAIWQRY
jgi:hypothetical protein